MLQWLIAHGVVVDREYGGIDEASYRGRFDALRLLMDAGADCGKLEFTPLHSAVAFGSLADVHECLLSTPVIDAKVTWSRTPLHLATLCEDVERINLLLMHGADPNAVDDEGSNALMLAVETNCALATVQALLASGIDVKHKLKTRRLWVWYRARNLPDVSWTQVRGPPLGAKKIRAGYLASRKKETVNCLAVALLTSRRTVIVSLASATAKTSQTALLGHVAQWLKCLCTGECHCAQSRRARQPSLH